VKKKKIYLDTSVISVLNTPEDLIRQKSTQEFWNLVKAGCFDVCVSRVVLGEIERCSEPKLTKMLSSLAEINCASYENTSESIELSQKYIVHGGLPPKSRDDALHIAIASVNGCDLVASWNLKHLANDRANRAVKAVNILLGYKEIFIVPPIMIDKE
jgi:predicted nucleic acid-binding protein